MKIGVIGLGTLGEYYVRDFKKFKTKIVASKNSRLSSTLKKNNLIKKKYNINLYAAKSYKDFFKKKFDTVLICSPSDLHLNHLEKSLKNKKNVIIEKPIISLSKTKTEKYFKIKIKKILSYQKKIFYNLINEYYAKKYLKLFKKKDFKYKKFKMIYHTNGKHKYDDIMDDLLPHLFSILDNLIKYKKISDIKKKIFKDLNIIQFKADNCQCNIEFLQNAKRKKLKFGLDNLLVERETCEINENVKNFLICRSLKKRIKINNPLTENIRKITLNCKKYNMEKEYQKIQNNLTKSCKIYYA